jgi:methyl-accepting chemotaxis protein
MFRNLSFKSKLMSLVSLLCLVSVIVGFIGYRGLKAVDAKYAFVTDISVPKMHLANEMFIEYRRVRITLRTLGLTGISRSEAENAISDSQAAIQQYEEAKKKYLALGFAPGQKEVWDKVDAAWEDFKKTGTKVIELYRTGTPEARDKMLDIFFHECPEKAKIYTAVGKNLLKFHDDFIDGKVTEAKDNSASAIRTMIAAILVGLALGFGVGWVFASVITATIRQIVARLSENANQVFSASTQIASSSEELSEAASEQASSLEETATSLEQITSMVAKAAENADTTARSSTESQSKAEKGHESMSQMLSSMTEIGDNNSAVMAQVNESNDKMTEIVKVIQEIGEKTKVINDIVFQTKLLSFNASVEAARAGEHGKGFAVVAEEVGKLAQMSGNAAKEITDMLTGSISKVENIVSETKTNVEALVSTGKSKVESGMQVAQECSRVFNEILQNVSQVSGLAQAISVASKEQSQGISEINKAMSQLDTVTQQNSSTSEEAASAAEELSGQAESLKTVVDELVQVVDGASSKVIATATNFRSPRVVKAETKRQESRSNVVQLKKSPSPKLKAVAGDSLPSRDDSGFVDA